jgi:GNAT superfamily N-acetyltransferase
MPGAYTLRSATIKDAKKIAELSGQLGYPAAAADIAARLEALAGESSHHIAVAQSAAPGSRGLPRPPSDWRKAAKLVAQSEIAEVLGWIHVMTLTHLESGAFAEIAGLVVDEKHRGMGIGKALVRDAEVWAATQGCKTIVVRSNVLRTETHKFYEGLGYPVLKEQRVFKKLI